MSSMTEVIVLCDRDDASKIENMEVSESGAYKLERVRSRLFSAILVAWVNYLDWEMLRDGLNEKKFTYPHDVQVFVKWEQADQFSMFRLPLPQDWPNSEVAK